ncbi:MAG: sodium:solute symporter family transporter [Armatimonadota bacterium]
MQGFTNLDYSIVGIYMLASIMMGVWFARRQKSVESYFVASRAAPWWAVGISIIATDLSAVSYMGTPAWVFEKDLQYSMGILLLPLIMVLVVWLFVPFMARLKLFTVYEYLERRFSPGVRTFGSALFLLLRGGWIANAIYVQALALSEILGYPFLWCVLMVGGASALYTILGGIEAVLWTDVMQFFVLVGGIVAMIAAVVFSFHGNIGEIWRLAAEGGHTRMVSYDLNLHSEVSLWALLAGLLVVHLSMYGSDQVTVQRYFTTKSKKDMTRAVMFNGLLVVPVILALAFVGLAFVAYYKMHPALSATLTNAQKVLPHFVAHVLPPGLSGLVIAGLLAATMSSLSAGFNSLGAATFIDFVNRLRKSSSVVSESQKLCWARWCTVFWSIGSTCAALYVSRLGSIFQIAGKINGFFSGPLVGIFLLGVLTKRANSGGVLVGAIVGTTVTWIVASCTSIGWLWYGPAGCLSTLSIGYLVSLLKPVEVSESLSQLTVWAKQEEVNS